jgi:RNA polymerase sigma-70 factor, ECF subfamily
LGGSRGSYVLQAAIAGCHARARSADQTDWEKIAELYSELAALTGSPMVELGRAVAVGMAYGPAEALERVDALATEPALQNSHRLPSVRGDLLFKLNRFEEARCEFERAAQLALNRSERRMLLERLAACELVAAREPGG